MKPFRIVGMGLSGLVGRPLRTSLTALGIVVGVAAVVTLTSLGNGIRESVAGQITDLGPNLITVMPGSGAAPGNGPPDGGPLAAAAASTLTAEDAKNVAGLPSVTAVSSNVATGGLVEGKTVQFSGVDPSFEQIRTLDLAAGRFLERGSEIVLSGSDARDFLDASPGEAIGETITIRGASVGGVGPASDDAGGTANTDRARPDPKTIPKNVAEDLAEGVPKDRASSTAQNGASRAGATRGAMRAPGPVKEYEVVGVVGSQPVGIGPAQPTSSYISTRDALDLSGSGTVGQILVSAKNAGSVGEAKAEITSEIREAHGEQEDFSVVTQEELLSTLTRITDELNVFLAGIAGISLLVGGIGVMNIMLVSVAERTREIGVRKAIGATDVDVLLQFLFEAVLLSALGGAAGVGLGVASSVLLPTLLTDLPRAVFGPVQVGLAFGVSALIGVLFGSLPAYHSARLAPVEALRRE